MSHKLLKRTKIRKNRMMRIRKKLRGSSERPRLSVSKSIFHIGVQLIDDDRGVTITSFSTLSKEAKNMKKSKESARFVGQKIAELAKQKNIEKVIFDRGRFKFHGLIAELANAARENGLKF
ncbi:MAG: 50S ribosomal protein L18 [Chlamydiae bacterium]|nr:50S ribosomal protein L18 [Chlamydiota bacterium]